MTGEYGQNLGKSLAWGVCLIHIFSSSKHSCNVAELRADISGLLRFHHMFTPYAIPIYNGWSQYTAVMSERVS